MASEPTAGAMRAAKAIHAAIMTRCPTTEEFAAIIDAEGGLAELAKRALRYKTAAEKVIRAMEDSRK